MYNLCELCCNTTLYWHLVPLIRYFWIINFGFNIIVYICYRILRVFMSHIYFECKLRCYHAQVLHHLLFQESINYCHWYWVSDLMLQLLVFSILIIIISMVYRLVIRFSENVYYICLLWIAYYVIRPEINSIMVEVMLVAFIKWGLFIVIVPVSYSLCSLCLWAF